LLVTLQRSALGRVNLHGQAARRTILIQNSKLNIQNFLSRPADRAKFKGSGLGDARLLGKENF